MLEVVRMLNEQGLSVQHFSKSMEFGPSGIRRWLEQYGAEQNGQPGIGKLLTAARLDSPRIARHSCLHLSHQLADQLDQERYAAFCFLGFSVVITSVMEQSFRHYLMIPFHTEILIGSQYEPLTKLLGQCDRRTIIPARQMQRQ